MQHNISGANKKHDYYFSGMCVCNDCGSGMSGIIIKRKVKEKGNINSNRKVNKNNEKYKGTHNSHLNCN